jgi:hypothetical protein
MFNTCNEKYIYLTKIIKRHALHPKCRNENGGETCIIFVFIFSKCRKEYNTLKTNTKPLTIGNRSGPIALLT